MTYGELYWSVIEPVWEHVSIYHDGETFLYDFRKLTAAQKVLLPAHWCQSETRNGGLHQFFSNPTGVLAPEAIVAFRELDLPLCAEAVEQAARFFGPEYPRAQEVRRARLDAHSASNEKWDPFEAFDDQFFDAIVDDGFEKAADAFARNVRSA